jgi:hypothetical protein
MAAAFAAATAALMAGFGRLDFRPTLPTKRNEPPVGGHSYRSKGHARPNGTSGQRASMDRLIIDRSSSVRKIDRWTRNGTLLSSKPRSDAHLLRHGWYRRQKQKEARAAATEAWQATT